MKNFLLVPACLLLAGLSYGQASGNESVSRTQTIEQLAATSPSEYQAVLEYAASNGSVIMDLPKGKESKLNGTISQEKAQMVNPVKMGLTIPSVNEYYRIEGTEKMLMVKSLYILQLEMKNKH